MYACACVQIKLWHIPDEGLSDNLTDSTSELVGHSKKVNYIEWHPTAADILLSAAADLQVVTLLLLLLLLLLDRTQSTMKKIKNTKIQDTT